MKLVNYEEFFYLGFEVARYEIFKQQQNFGQVTMVQQANKTVLNFVVI